MLQNVINRFATKPDTSITDADAFAELYRQHIHPVFNYILFRVGDRVVAEDLTADT